MLSKFFPKIVPFER